MSLEAKLVDLEDLNPLSGPEPDYGNYCGLDCPGYNCGVECYGRTCGQQCGNGCGLGCGTACGNGCA